MGPTEDLVLFGIRDEMSNLENPLHTGKLSLEIDSGLDAWSVADLPKPQIVHALSFLGVIGPGAILLGLSIGSGEWILGPAAFVRYGLALLWVTTIAVILQTVFNLELMRYTMYTGEPIITGFMRCKPGSKFWAGLYTILCVLQVGWPGWAAAAASAIFYLFLGHLPGIANSGTIYWIGVGTFLLSVTFLLFGRRIERSLESLNWILLTIILSGLILLCILFASPGQWLATLVGFVGIDLTTRSFNFIPPGADWSLLGAFAAYSGAGGICNLMLSNWVRDKGFGMGSIVGYIPTAMDGVQNTLAHSGTIFKITPGNLTTWKAWWRIAQVDQWLVFGIGSLLGMGLPALLYTAAIQRGSDIRGLAIAAALAHAMAGRGGVALTFIVALMGAWILFKTQLVILDGTVRSITDILWAVSPRVRKLRGGDVRVIYYSVLGVFVVWGLIALRLTQPIILLELSANVAGLTLVVAGLHVLYVNTTLLPKELQPPLWRRICLVCLALFYGLFVYLWLMGGFIPDPAKGFIFTLSKLIGR